MIPLRLYTTDLGEMQAHRYVCVVLHHVDQIVAPRSATAFIYIVKSCACPLHTVGLVHARCILRHILATSLLLESDGNRGIGSSKRT